MTKIRFIFGKSSRKLIDICNQQIIIRLFYDYLEKKISISNNILVKK